MRYLLHTLAAGILIFGLAIATLIPDAALSFCFDWRLGNCAGADPMIVRAVIASVSGVTALMLWMIGSTARQ